MCIRRHASAPFGSSTDRTRVRTLPFMIKANEQCMCMQHFKCASPSAFTAARENRISFHFALAHQRLRDCADEAHVDSEAETKDLILCIASIERKRFAQASQVLEQFGIKRFRHSQYSAATSWICGFNERAPLPCMNTK